MHQTPLQKYSLQSQQFSKFNSFHLHNQSSHQINHLQSRPLTSRQTLQKTNNTLNSITKQIDFLLTSVHKRSHQYQIQNIQNPHIVFTKQPSSIQKKSKNIINQSNEIKINRIKEHYRNYYQFSGPLTQSNSKIDAGKSQFKLGSNEKLQDNIPISHPTKKPIQPSPQQPQKHPPILQAPQQNPSPNPFPKNIHISKPTSKYLKKYLPNQNNENPSHPITKIKKIYKYTQQSQHQQYIYSYQDIQNKRNQSPIQSLLSQKKCYSIQKQLYLPYGYQDIQVFKHEEKGKIIQTEKKEKEEKEEKEEKKEEKEKEKMEENEEDKKEEDKKEEEEKKEKEKEEKREEEKVEKEKKDSENIQEQKQTEEEIGEKIQQKPSQQDEDNQNRSINSAQIEQSSQQLQFSTNQLDNDNQSRSIEPTQIDQSTQKVQSNINQYHNSNQSKSIKASQIEQSSKTVQSNINQFGDDSQNRFIKQSQIQPFKKEVQSKQNQYDSGSQSRFIRQTQIKQSKSHEPITNQYDCDNQRQSIKSTQIKQSKKVIFNISQQDNANKSRSIKQTLIKQSKIVQSQTNQHDDESQRQSSINSTFSLELIQIQTSQPTLTCSTLIPNTLISLPVQSISSQPRKFTLQQSSSSANTYINQNLKKPPIKKPIKNQPKLISEKPLKIPKNPKQQSLSSFPSLSPPQILPPKLTPSTIYSYLAHKFTSLLHLDTQLLHYKKHALQHPFTQKLSLPQKKSQLKQAFQNHGIPINTTQINQILSYDVYHHKGFLSPSQKSLLKNFSQFLSIFMLKYLQAQTFWQQQIKHTLPQIYLKQFQFTKLDHDHKNYLIVSDLTSFINLYGSDQEYLQNRVVKQLFNRFFGNQNQKIGKLLYHNFINIIFQSK